MRLLPTVAALALLAAPTLAQPAMPPYAPDDIVYLDLATEGFVTTKTAKVQVSVNAAANDEKASSLRADMQKAVSDLAGSAGNGADWRLTSFNRSQDQSGLTRWDAVYEARIAEKDLGGMNDRAKKLSKPGMALSVMNIDFTPTLAEAEAKKAELRQDLYKRASDELARLNASLPGRTYRISDISFAAPGQPVPMPRPMMVKSMRADAAAPMMAEANFAGGSAGAEVSQELTLTARVTYAARPPQGAAPVQPQANTATTKP